MPAPVGLITGTGLYELDGLAGRRTEDVGTPYGTATVTLGELDGVPVAHVPRHGAGHARLSHQVTPRANVAALAALGVTALVSTTVCGAVDPSLELGQLVAILLAVPVVALLFRYVVNERVGTIILSAIVAHTAWHWMTERGSELFQYQFQAPAFDAASIAAMMRWLMLLLILVGVIALLVGAFGRAIDRIAEPGEAARD